jgi:deoxynucleoside triphosphate triphosphohydrolase SAMHD1
MAALDRLRATWRRQGTLEAVENALDRIGFSAPYVEHLCRQAQHRSADKPKVIKDNVWGMVEVEASSLRLLDSPLVQRLRGIHQLGLTYLTYPSAEHSRFIHSLGMFCVVSRFLQIMARRKLEGPVPDAPYSTWSPSERISETLKHAAILHDCGHFPYSHVTEQIFEADRTLFHCGPVTVDDFELPVHDLLGTSSKLAECISIAIVLTDRFKRFYLGWVDPTARAEDVRKIAALISGSTQIGDLNGIAGLISGTSIDADKIDYINRDSVACGIPVGVDVARLFLRSSFISVSAKEWMRLHNLDHLPARGEIVFVVNASGLDSIEEIVQARTALYHRVYLHQTTRNAERLLGAAIHSDAGLGVRNLQQVGPPRLRDALRLWSLNDVQLMDALTSSRVSTARNLAYRLRDRDLPNGRVHLAERIF